MKFNLPYDENFLSFEFAALSYISPERNQYAYKMEGLDKDWVYSGTRRYASYPNLDPVNMYSELKDRTMMEYGMKLELQFQ